MISVYLLLLFFGFYILYFTSKRMVAVPTLKFETWIKTHNSAATMGGLSLLLLSCFLFIYSLGLAAGILTYMVMLMTIGSLIILLAPLQLLTYPKICGVFLLALFIELFLI